MTKLTPLANWLNEQPAHIIATHKGEAVNTQDFVVRVQQWITVLTPQQGDRWAVYHADSFEFLAIIFALWQLSRTACIPGDNRQGTTAKLSSHVAGFIGEFPNSDNVIKLDVDVDVTQQQWRQLDDDFVALEIYTSGSTGDATAISKTIQQLDQESQVLAALWAKQTDGVVLSTVSHQHLYGMTFRLFLPFISGQAFERYICNYSEDIIHYAHYYSCFSLVSSPSHLSRMNMEHDWQQIAERCHGVLSSAAPLAREDSLNVSQLLNVPVREVYGSSETGAIAWRCQQETEQDAAWQAMPKTQLSITGAGTLSVQSPYSADNKAFIVADRVSFNDQGQFHLLGREDSIVKVEGKRVSLTAIEQLLLKNSLIEDVKAIVLERQRVEVVIVASLTTEGENYLDTQGRKAVIAILKAILAGAFEAVVLPRRWRFVAEMPYNEQGKLPLVELKTLFDKQAVTKPVILQKQWDDDVYNMTILIPKQLIYFEGHFQDNPILPGVVQIHWAELFGRELFAITDKFKQLEVIKFQRLILPEDSVKMSLSYDDKKRLSFKYASEKGVHASGRICFG